MFTNTELFERLAERFQHSKAISLTPIGMSDIWATICAVLHFQLTRVPSQRDKGARINIPNAFSFVRWVVPSVCSVPNFIFIPSSNYLDSYNLRYVHPVWKIRGEVRTSDVNVREMSRQLASYGNIGPDDASRFLSAAVDILGDYASSNPNSTVKIEIIGIGTLTIEKRKMDFKFQVVAPERVEYSLRSAAASSRASITRKMMNERELRPGTAPLEQQGSEKANTAAGENQKVEGDTTNEAATGSQILANINQVLNEKSAPELRRMNVQPSGGMNELPRPSASRPGSQHFQPPRSASVTLKPNHSLPPTPDRFAEVKARRYHVEKDLDILATQLQQKFQHLKQYNRPFTPSSVPREQSQSIGRGFQESPSRFSDFSTGRSASALSGTLNSNQSTRVSSFKHPPDFAVEQAMESAFSRHRQKLQKIREEDAKYHLQWEVQQKAGILIDQLENRRKNQTALQVRSALTQQIEEKGGLQRSSSGSELSMMHSRDLRPFEAPEHSLVVDSRWVHPKVDKIQRGAEIRAALDEQVRAKKEKVEKERQIALTEEKESVEQLQHAMVLDATLRLQEKQNTQDMYRLAWKSQIEVGNY